MAVAPAQTLDANLTLIHVWELPAYPYKELMLGAGDWASSVERAAAKRLDEALREIQQRLPVAKSALMGVPWREIVASATSLGADLIVMGTHGRRGLGHALLGSVAEKAVRTSSVPVLTAREPTAA